MVEAGPATRGLLLVNFRPEYRAGWMQRSNYQQLAVRPLGPEAIRQLLEDLLGADPSLAGLAETIQARTAGNPFFIEEVVQSLIESGKLTGTRSRYRLLAPIETLGDHEDERPGFFDLVEETPGADPIPPRLGLVVLERLCRLVGVPAVDRCVPKSRPRLFRWRRAQDARRVDTRNEVC